MARINTTVTTKTTALEMRRMLDERVLSNPELQTLLPHHHWDGMVLHASGPLGKGTVALADYRIVIDIELSIFGSVAKRSIEERLVTQLSRLGGQSSPTP